VSRRRWDILTPQFTSVDNRGSANDLNNCGSIDIV
jgi:hypothetical protein